MIASLAAGIVLCVVLAGGSDSPNDSSNAAAGARSGSGQCSSTSGRRDAGAPAADKARPAESAGADQRKATTFLTEAAREGDTEAVKAALKAGVAPNSPTSPFAAKQLTALHWAVTRRIADSGKTVEPSPEITRLLIEAGADVNAADYLGQTPLEWAAGQGSPEIVQMLIKAGADVNAMSRYGTVLMAGTRVEIARLLIEAGADVNGGTTMTPLANAAQNGDAALVRLLVEKGAKVNDPKVPPLHWAGKPETAKALLDAGADPNLRNAKGETALHTSIGAWSPKPRPSRC